MLLDQFSLLTAVGFSSAALGITLLGAWFGSRRDWFLLNWSIGLVSIVIGVILFCAVGDGYVPMVQMMSFWALIVGFGLICAGSMQFCFARARWVLVALTVAGGVAATSAAFISGFSGTGTALGNFGIAVLMVLAARQYWLARSEFRFAMAVNAAFYGVTAVSFFLCGFVLLVDRQFVLTARPTNWAENINAIVAIVGLTGIGALSLMLNQARAARRHRNDALTDPLTGLLNRRALCERYVAVLSWRTAVILFDLDHFKEINDRYGHAAGDIVLKRFADVIRRNLSSADLAARVGGEEFCLIMHNTGYAEALAVAERIRLEFASLVIATPSAVIKATASGGIALSVDKSRSLESVLQEADAALYDAKTNGRNKVCGVASRVAA